MSPTVLIPEIDCTFENTLTTDTPIPIICSAKYTLSKKLVPTPIISDPEDVVLIPVTPPVLLPMDVFWIAK